MKSPLLDLINVLTPCLKTEELPKGSDAEEKYHMHPTALTFEKLLLILNSLKLAFTRLEIFLLLVPVPDSHLSRFKKA